MDWTGKQGRAAWWMVLALSLTPALAAGDWVAENGPLRVDGAQLVNSRGEPIQLRGMSSHCLHWFPQFASFPSILETKKRGANVFRLAMYADSVEGGYSESEEHAANNKRLLYEGLENALAAGMYVIVDWHLLKDQNPLPTTHKAAQFFQEVTARYPNHPAILYEICNEPNGDTTWEQIRLYAQMVIPVIRAQSPDAVILVGTPRWSSDVLAVLSSPLDHANVMYAYHLYTGYAHYEYVEKLGIMAIKGLPVFVSEWGMSKDEVTGELDLQEGADFIDFMRQYRISWANWSLSNKDEDFSALRPEVTKLEDWTEDELTPSGRLIFPALSGE